MNPKHPHEAPATHTTTYSHPQAVYPQGPVYGPYQAPPVAVLSAPAPQAPQAPMIQAPPVYVFMGGQPPAPPAPPAQHTAPEEPSGYGAHKGCGHSKGGCGKRRGRFRFLKFLLFLAIIWGTAVISFKHGHKIVHFIQMKRIAKEMDLTHSQKRKLVGLMWGTIDKNEANRKKVRQMRRDFLQLMEKKDLTQKELDEFIKKSMAEIQSIVLANTNTIMKARAVLSPEQRSILIHRVKQLRRRGHWRRHRHHRRHHREWH